jgi:3,4-dihydroxyphenylacetate 2,3-dioxygenase
MWQHGEWADFCAMLPEYAAKGHGEGFMHDTAMLLGALGWSATTMARPTVVTPYFGASGTGQINAMFPVTPQDGQAVPVPEASRADGYNTPVSAGFDNAAMPHLVILYTPNLDAIRAT